MKKVNKKKAGTSKAKKKDPKKQIQLLQISICGDGQDQVNLLGKILGCAAVLHKRFVGLTPSRGFGPYKGSLCLGLVISNAWIGYPCVEEPDYLIALSQKGYDDCLDRGLKKETLIFLDSSSIKPAKNCKCTHYRIPAIDTTKKELKREDVAGMMLLALLSRISRVASLDYLTKAIRANVSLEDVSPSLKALELGSRLARKFI